MYEGEWWDVVVVYKFFGSELGFGGRHGVILLIFWLFVVILLLGRIMVLMFRLVNSFSRRMWGIRLSIMWVEFIFVSIVSMQVWTLGIMLLFIVLLVVRVVSLDRSIFEICDDGLFMLVRRFSMLVR